MRAKGDGTIYQRPDGRYAVAWWFEGRRYSGYAPTLRQAQARLARLKYELKTGARSRDERRTVASFLTAWLDGEAGRLSAGTLAQHRARVAHHITPVIGPLRLARLRPEDVQQVAQTMAAAGLSPGTIRLTHALLRQALAAAVRLELLSRNPADAVRAPRKPPGRARPLSVAQAETLLRAAETDPLGALYTLALGTGMRQGEVLALRWEDVDLPGARLVVRASMRRQAGGAVRGETKAKRPRPALLAGFVVTRLRRHREQQQPLSLWVFPGYRGAPLAAQTLSARWRAFTRAAGLPAVRFHDLRHSTATLLIAKGVHPSIVASLLGHAHASMTLDVYSHAAPELQAEAVRALEALMGGPDGRTQSPAVVVDSRFSNPTHGRDQPSNQP